MDKNLVAERARGHWSHVLQSLCRLDAGVFDGRNQPCPKCGGTDRFRVYGDFSETGGFYCNQCKQKEGGDGFAFLQWFHGWTFTQAVNEVGKLLAVAELPPREQSRQPANVPLADKWRRWGVDPEQRRALVAAWCECRPPSDVDAALKSGAMVGNWPPKSQDQGVVAFAGSLDGGASMVALLLYRQDGAAFPALGKLQERKTHLVGGSVQSWVAVGGWDRVKAARVIVRVEGIPDGLALLPMLPADWAICDGHVWGRMATDAIKAAPVGIVRWAGVRDCGRCGSAGSKWCQGDGGGRRGTGCQCRSVDGAFAICGAGNEGGRSARLVAAAADVCGFQGVVV